MREISLQIARLLFFSIVLSPCLLHAQPTSSSTFEHAIVAEFCDSFTKASPRISKENMRVEMGMMFIPLLSKYSSQIKNEWGLDVGSPADLSKTGEKVGQLAALNCPAFLEYIKTNLKEIVDQGSPEIGKTFAGKILKVEGQPFVYILVQNKQGKIEKLYWLEYFEGADKLTSQVGVYLNKDVVISYKEMEVYQLTDKEYRTVKVLTKISFKS